MSLRRRLVLGMLVLLAAAIVTTDVFTYSSLRSFLVGRLDEQADVAQDQVLGYIYRVYLRDLQAGDQLARHDTAAWLAQLASPAGPSACGVQAAPSSLAPAQGVMQRGPRLNAQFLSASIGPDVYVEIIGSTGALLFCRPSGSNPPDPPPRLPASMPVQAVANPHVFGSRHGPYFPDQPAVSVGAVASSNRYWAQAVALPGGRLVTAVSLAPADQTLASLVRIELIVSVVVGVALVGLALLTVRFGLRPLEAMADTAGAIAAGDLSRRVAPTDERSEVGRLGRALNAMLSQIEAAFRERSRSEARLRRFVGDASHELRTPLTSIRGYAELLRKGALGDDDSRRRAAERIEHEAARMSVLVDDLLLLARLDQGRPLELAPVDLGAVAAEAVEALRAVDPKRPVTLQVDGDVTVLGDSGRLRQVVDNLLRNAAVHTPPGTAVQVAVVHDRHEIVLTVADEGPGLTPEDADRAFDRFYRGSRARTGAGVGLGLSIVAALAAAHGGAASVRSVPGEGAAFTVRLPAAAPERVPEPAPPSAGPAATGATVAASTDAASVAGH